MEGEYHLSLYLFFRRNRALPGLVAPESRNIFQNSSSRHQFPQLLFFYSQLAETLVEEIRPLIPP
jgi:hypothetical protein